MRRFAVTVITLITFVILACCCTGLAENPNAQWICPNCGRKNTGNFCPDCGTKRESWICPTCGNNNLSAFCENCGTARPGSVEEQEAIPSVISYMNGNSMNDTIKDGDLLFGYSIALSELKRFDIVMVNYPGRDETIFIKRLVAFPGETIALIDGYLYIDDVKYEEAFINDAYRTGTRNEFGPYTIPENRYFVLGDHRNNSNDCRYTGPLSAEMVLGVIREINGLPYETPR